MRKKCSRRTCTSVTGKENDSSQLNAASGGTSEKGDKKRKRDAQEEQEGKRKSPPPPPAAAQNSSEDAVLAQDTGGVTLADPPLPVDGIPEDASPSEQVRRAVGMAVTSMAGDVEMYRREVHAPFVKSTQDFCEGLSKGVTGKAERMITDLEARDYGQLRSTNEQIVRAARWKAAKEASLAELPNDINSRLCVPVRADDLEAARAKGVLEGQVGEFARGFCCCAVCVAVALFVVAGY